MNRAATVGVVIVAGVAAALVRTSLDDRGETRNRSLEDLSSTSDAIRIEAWNAVPPDADDPTRRAILDRLVTEGVPESARAAAGRAFLNRGWPVPDELAIAAGRAGDLETFAAWWRHAWPTRPEALDRVGDVLSGLASRRDRHGDLALEHLLSRTTLDEVPRVSMRLTAPEGTRLDPRLRLALGRLGSPADRVEDAADALQSLLADPELEDREVLSRIPAWALATGGTAARAQLEASALAGEPDARRVMAMRDPTRLREAEQATLADVESTFARRGLAAFRLLAMDDGPGEDAILDLLEAGPADRDGTVHVAALLAIDGLSPATRRSVVASWLESGREDAWRAAMLATGIEMAGSGRSGTPWSDVVALADRLARDPASEPGLRRTARHLLHALERWPFPDLDPVSYAGRTTRLRDGRLDPDAVLLGILAGDPEATRRLGDRPRLGGGEDRADRLARAIMWRRALLARLASDRLASIGEPVPGDEADLLLWIDSIAARNLLRGPIEPEDREFADRAASGDTARP